MKVMDFPRLAELYPDIKAIELEPVAYADLRAEFQGYSRRPYPSYIFNESMWVNGIRITCKGHEVLHVDGTEITAGAVIEGPK
jgi:hypothetical protein